MDFGKFSYTTGLLNCQIQRIEPHHAARFAMRLAISTNTGDNPDHVYWTLFDDAGSGPEASAPVRLE
jgi:hypothetical protein